MDILNLVTMEISVSISNILEEMNKSNKSNYKDVSFSIISNIGLEPLFAPILIKQFTECRLNSTAKFIAYEESFTEKNAKSICESNIVIVWVNFEAMFGDLLIKALSGQCTYQNMTSEIVDGFRIYIAELQKYNKQIIWISYEDLNSMLDLSLGRIMSKYHFADAINNILYDYFDGQIAILDIHRSIARIGLYSSFDDVGKYRWNCPYGKELMSEIAKELYKQYLIINGITKKCIILDCDNVLWGGILSEEGIENIKLGDLGIGRFFRDLQQYILSLYYLGITIAICSKNDYDDVLNVIRNHDGMLIKEEHISCMKVNWNEKVDNIVEIANELNISIDSMVFVDDSIFEIEAAKSMLPELVSIKLEAGKMLDNHLVFNVRKSEDLDSIINRNETYRTNRQRDQLKSGYRHFDEYLAALKTRVKIKLANKTEISRISELSQRTNRCTNGRRYSVIELQNLMKNESYRLYSVSVADRFGDLGLVGCVGLSEGSIDLFCLSCRALGRNIEKEMLEFIINEVSITDFAWKSTNKNNVLKELLSKKIKDTSL